jgi:hypothetical protein
VGRGFAALEPVCRFPGSVIHWELEFWRLDGWVPLWRRGWDMWSFVCHVRWDRGDTQMHNTRFHLLVPIHNFADG